MHVHSDDIYGNEAILISTDELGKKQLRKFSDTQILLLAKLDISKMDILKIYQWFKIDIDLEVREIKERQKQNNRANKLTKAIFKEE